MKTMLDAGQRVVFLGCAERTLTDSRDHDTFRHKAFYVDKPWGGGSWAAKRRRHFRSNPQDRRPGDQTASEFRIFLRHTQAKGLFRVAPNSCALRLFLRHR